jgi:L-ribulose-5-phosphate 3-epimerase
LSGHYSRRALLGASIGAASLSFAGRREAATARPRLGVVTRIGERSSPEEAISKVHAFGLPTCQVSAGPAPDTRMAAPLRQALDQYGVEVTAIMTLGPGPMVWDFYSGPKTIGIVPESTRAARVDALKRASDLGAACHVGAVHTHCGFIPENPNDPLYAETVRAIQDVASYCKSNGQIFLMETGQESPITMLRAIEDAGTGNIYVNLDTANLILYGKGEPVGALDVLGKYVRGLHAKDGMYPVDPKKLGREVAIGQGRVDFPGVIRALHRLSYTGPITIERETSGPQQEADIRSSKIFLENLISSTYSQA